MPTFERCDKSVETLAKDLLGKFDTHKPVLALDVKIDFVFAYADVTDQGKILNDALTKGGIKALGITRAIGLKDRALGRGDAEIAIDGDWWKLATEDQQAALLDHELHHLAVKSDRAGNAQYDDLGRPQIKLRKHDIEVGWFRCIAERHGAASQERIQARQIMDRAGQYFWPGIAPTVELIANGISSGPIPLGAFAKAVSTKIPK
jgi:Putative phage metallopeptidase